MIAKKVDYRGVRIVALWGGGFWQAYAADYAAISGERTSLDAAIQEVRDRLGKTLGFIS